MNYTNEKEQIVFLKDADIANNLEGKTISSEAITTNGILLIKDIVTISNVKGN